MLVNGHRVNDSVYDQAPIGADFGVDVALFDRVEIISGPASSLYGTSAFFAVVNVITRSGASLAGISVEIDAGTLGTAMARISGGKRFANGVDLIVSGTLDRVGGDNRLYFPAFDTPTTNSGVAEDLDAERIGDVYGRLTVGDFAFMAAVGRRSKFVPTASFGTIFNEQITPERTTDQHAMITGEYNRTFGATHVAFDAGFDRYDYNGVYPFASENPAYPYLDQPGRRAGHPLERRCEALPAAAGTSDGDRRRHLLRQPAAEPMVQLQRSGRRVRTTSITHRSRAAPTSRTKSGCGRGCC